MTGTPEATTGQFKSISAESSTNSKNLINCITDALLEKKAKDIVLLDVRNLTTLTDYFIISHGTSETQIKALANNVLDQTSKVLREKAWKKEGMDTRRWIILDYVNVVVHIFNEEKREYYGIERMWNDAERTEISDE